MPKKESTTLDYEIISSCSSGNAVRIDKVMIDCGVPYSKMKSSLYKCKLLFITHIHSDHLNTRTLHQIRKKHKSIKTIANYEVAQKVGDIDIVIGDNPKPIKLGNITLEPFRVKHDVVTHGTVITIGDLSIIYVTDSAGTDTWPAGKYDYLFLESNHDENILREVDKKSYGYDVFAASKRHTSMQESKAFYYINRKNKDSPWIELHKSERFY